MCCSFAKGLGGNACCRFAAHIGTPRTHCTRRRAHVARPMGMHTVVDRVETCGRGVSGVWRPMGEQRASWKGGRTRVAAAALSEVWSGGSARDQRHVLACSAFRLQAAATVGVCACVGPTAAYGPKTFSCRPPLALALDNSVMTPDGPLTTDHDMETRASCRGNRSVER